MSFSNPGVLYTIELILNFCVFLNRNKKAQSCRHPAEDISACFFLGPVQRR